MAWTNDGRRTVRCRKCWEKGHNIRNCPKNTPEEKAAYTDGSKARLCSWCGEPKHNKTSCEKRATEKREYIIKNAEFRKNVLAFMRNNGIGIGTLITDSYREDKVYIVTQIDWNMCQERKPYNRIVIGEEITNTKGWERRFSASPVPNNWDDKTIIVAPVNTDNIMDTVPPGWLDGTSDIDQYF